MSALRPTVLVDLAGKECNNKAQGLMFFLGGVASLLGTPFAGTNVSTVIIISIKLPFHSHISVSMSISIKTG